jgi:hypothetical protein
MSPTALASMERSPSMVVQPQTAARLVFEGTAAVALENEHALSRAGVITGVAAFSPRQPLEPADPRPEHASTMLANKQTILVTAKRCMSCPAPVLSPSSARVNP